MIDCDWDDDQCTSCEMRFFDLIDQLIMDIRHLEPKVVYLRYLLSMYLPEWDGEMLRCDIFSDLVGSYWDRPAYQDYLKAFYDGHDPLDSDEFNGFMWRLSRGEASANL